MDININKQDIFSHEMELFLHEPPEVQEIINTYMTTQCPLSISEQKVDHHLYCNKYHDESQKRRKPFRNGRLLYRTEICMYNSNFCKKYEDCDKSHNNYEYCFHPEKFRTSSCNMSNCQKFGKICPFSHSLDTLRNSYSYSNNNLNIINNKYNYLNLNIQNPQANMDVSPLSPNTAFNNDSMKRLNDKIFRIGIDENDIANFKVYPCNIYTKHNEKQCVFFHSSKDFKRMISKFSYSFELCKFAEAGRNCPNGDFCSKSHNRVEQFYHPDKFKSKFCSHFNNLNNCPYGNFCSFAHSESNIKIELIHKYEQNEDFFIFYFKSVWCPFNHAHDKSSCVYAHNWQDYRRSPAQYQYSENVCSVWDNKKTILNYHEGCINEYRCKNCHGWKEQDYHPFVYKTKKCKYLLAFCNKGLFCPFYHKEEKQRIIDQTEQELINGKIEQRIPLNIYVSPVHLLQNEFNNKSDLVVAQRNSAMSIDFRPFVNNSYNQNRERNSLLENIGSNLNVNNTYLDNNPLLNITTNNTNSNVNNISVSIENRLTNNTNTSYSNLITERSGSIFSNKSIRSIKVLNKMNPRVSMIAKNTSRLSIIRKDKSRVIPRFSVLLAENNFEDRLEDIEDEGNSQYSSDFDENLDLSGDFSKIMKKDSNKYPMPKFSIFSKDNNKGSILKNSLSRLDSLRNENFQQLRGSFFDNFGYTQRASLVPDEKPKEHSIEDQKYKEQLLNYLLMNNFLILHKKILEEEMTTKEICSLQDEGISELVEEENKGKITDLKKFLNDLDDAQDYENLLKKIDKNVLNAENAAETTENAEK